MITREVTHDNKASFGPGIFGRVFPLIDRVLPDQAILLGFVTNTDVIICLESVSIPPQSVIPLPAMALMLAGLDWAGHHARRFP